MNMCKNILKLEVLAETAMTVAATTTATTKKKKNTVYSTLSMCNATASMAASRYPDLFFELRQKFDDLQGEFVSKPRGYEKELADILKWEHENHTDFDLKYKGYEIEIKKGQDTVWFNKLRYIEPKNDKNVTLCLFYKNKENVINDFLLIDSNTIRKKLLCENGDATCILRGYKKLYPKDQMMSSLRRKHLLKLASLPKIIKKDYC